MFFLVNVGVGLLTLFMVFSVMAKLDRLQRQVTALVKRIPPRDDAAGEPAEAGDPSGNTTES